jgi:DNA-binding NtrC family response regulator
MKLAKRVANSSASVLLTGESGTGKELFAQLIHHSSQRLGEEFVRVNCAALPANLIESELFGHEKGSFTDAVQARTGRFELANKGTLLLDEVTEIPLTTQAKLLRVLEESEFERVGSNQPIQTDVRIVATSNRDLLHEVEKGNFRLDLFHRLNVVQIEIPSLRDRLIDVPLLAMHFVNRFQEESEIRIQGFTAAAMQALSQHDWPGNVRELRNLIHRACILTTQPLIDVDCLGPLGAHSLTRKPVAMPDQWLHTKLADIEKQIILAACQKYGNKRVVAEKLGVSTRTLTNKLKIYREQSEGSGGDELKRPKAA